MGRWRYRVWGLAGLYLALLGVPALAQEPVPPLDARVKAFLEQHR